MFDDADEVVVHSLRQAAQVFKVSPDTVRLWAMNGRVEGSQDGAGRWTIRIRKDHPDLPENRSEGVTRHYPLVDDPRDAEIAGLRAENERLADEVGFLREQIRQAHGAQLALIDRLLEASRPALPPPTRPWYSYLWPWSRPAGPAADPRTP